MKPTLSAQARCHYTMTEVDGRVVFNLEDEAHVKLQKEQRPHKVSFYVEKVYALKPRKAASENLQQRGPSLMLVLRLAFYSKLVKAGTQSGN
ncbi:hypothetical protein RHGRI_034042 [Rhododendron griersonianum]|uniref:Uncharacterized protein n=1 Tax=Rhododendron griersonianum TaxID=479676 RepID=A0AAV6HZ00_9ERIC|nr:hypothetical protein RHGRI_034042 [Rhododendron griersonianum]